MVMIILTLYREAICRGQKIISGGVNFMVAVDKEEKKTDFLKESLLLRQALSLCSSLVEKRIAYRSCIF